MSAGSPYRILVTGSRDWDDPLEVRLALIRASVLHLPGIVVIHGACPTGADAMTAEWAADYGVRTEEHPADWGRLGKGAGPRRNAEMVALGADTCLAFIRGASRGATHCADTAQQAGIPVQRYLRPEAA
jgi:hypothetical protein